MAAMMISYPLLAVHRMAAEAIAASGVDDQLDPHTLDPLDPTRHRSLSCPDCGGRLVPSGGCIGCSACGWSRCG